MIPQLPGRNGRLLMPILALLLMNLPVAEAKFELPEGSMGSIALVGLIFGSITWGFGYKHAFIYWFRVFFGRRPILSDVEGHERQRVSREWYHYAQWIASGRPPPSHALSEAAAARVLDVERQLFEEMPPPPRALPVRLFKTLFRTAKSFFPPATSGHGSTNETSEPRIPPQLQSPTAQRNKSATTPKELGVLHFQAFDFKPRRSKVLALVRKFADSPKDGGKVGFLYAGYSSKDVRRPRKFSHKRLFNHLLHVLENVPTTPNSTIKPRPSRLVALVRKLADTPKDGGKIGSLYAGYTPKHVRRSRKFSHKRLFTRLLRALENIPTNPKSNISHRDKGKAPEHRIPPQPQIPIAHTSRRQSHDPAKFSRGPKKSATPKDGGKVGFLYTGYTAKPVPRLKSTHKRSKSAKIKCIFLESNLVSRLLGAVENGFAPATSVDELTRENTRRNEGKAPEPRIPPLAPISAYTPEDGGKVWLHYAGYMNHGRKSAYTAKNGGKVGIHYAGYTPKSARRHRESIYKSKNATHKSKHATNKSKHTITEGDGKTRPHRSRSSNHNAARTPKSEQQNVKTPPPKAHTVATSRESEQQDVITPPPNAHMSGASSKHIEMPTEAATSHNSLHVVPSPFIKFAPDAINPHRRARKPGPSALISVLDLAYNISRKPVPLASSSTPDLSHTISRKPVPSASRT